MRDQALSRFGENVRAVRHAKGWTQEDLAARSGLAVVQVSRVERGAREIRLTTLLRLIQALDVAPAALLDGLLTAEPPQTRLGSVYGRRIQRANEASN